MIFNLNNIKTDFNLNNSLNSVNWRSKDFIIIQFAAMLSKIEFTVFIGWTCSASEDSFKSHFPFFLHLMLFVNNFNNRIKNNIKTIKRLPKIKGIKEIMYPGQNKYKRFKMNSKKNIMISKNVKKDLKILNN